MKFPYVALAGLPAVFFKFKTGRLKIELELNDGGNICACVIRKELAVEETSAKRSKDRKTNVERKLDDCIAVESVQ